MLAEILQEAKKRAMDEFHIEFPSEMYVADAFPIQTHMIKGSFPKFFLVIYYRCSTTCSRKLEYNPLSLHQHFCSTWRGLVFFFVLIYIQGPAPGFKGHNAPKTGWDKMEEYYDYLRSRSVKYGL